MRNLLLISISALLLAACGGSDEPQQQAATPAKASDTSGKLVEIKAFQFKPDPLDVKVGEKVTFVNFDSTLHTVTSKAEGFDEQLGGRDSETTVTFDKPGTIEYLCTVHSGPGMRGQITVR